VPRSGYFEKEGSIENSPFHEVPVPGMKAEEEIPQGLGGFAFPATCLLACYNSLE
jgi:hypothetical protein